LTQENFLSNDNNKRQLAALLCSAFEEQGILAEQAEEDADCDIVRTALGKATTFDTVVIIGEEVDLLVLLVLLVGLGLNATNVFF
jgi:hypothetical protein